MRRLLLTVAMASVLSGCASMKAEEEVLSAEADIRNKDNQPVGRATLIETPEGLRIAVTAFRLPPGPKGIHIHEAGVCQAPAFTSAGDHFNPLKKQHGRLNPAGPHAGDLPALTIAASGEGGIDLVTKAVTLRPGQPNSLLGGKGTSVVIHAGADDERTDPSGNSGDRLGCGVIMK
jgi:Cu-Zn family superoxide dismutase